MNCHGCGTHVSDNPSPEMVNQAVDEVLQASVEDAKRRGGVCPLCGHSQHVPFYKRKSFRIAVMVGILIFVGLGAECNNVFPKLITHFTIFSDCPPVESGLFYRSGGAPVACHSGLSAPWR